jgi:hypothetical protein
MARLAPGPAAEMVRGTGNHRATLRFSAVAARLQRVGQAEARAREMRARVEDERQVYNDWVDLPLIVLAGVR